MKNIWVQVLGLHLKAANRWVQVLGLHLKAANRPGYIYIYPWELYGETGGELGWHRELRLRSSIREEIENEKCV